MKKLFGSKKILIILFILFVVTEWYGYYFMQQIAEKRVIVEVEEYKKNLRKEINELTEYKDIAYVGNFVNLSPECIEIDLKYFEGSLINIPFGREKDKSEETIKDLHDFFYFFTKKRLDQNGDNPFHGIIKELKSLYKIQIPYASWTIQQMGWETDDRFWINNMRPIAVGYKKGANGFQSVYDACKGSFEYLTKESPIAKSFIDKPNLFNSILSFENKYFCILPAIYTDNEGKEISREEYLKDNDFCVFKYVNFPQTVVFYEETLTKNSTYYEICIKEDVYEEEVSNNTLLFWGIYTVIICFIFGIICFMFLSIGRNYKE